MASTATTVPTIPQSRMRAFFLPREHGAWGMLLVPLVTGAAAGSPHGERVAWILLFAVAALGLFCLRTPVEAGLHLSPLRPQNSEERRLIHTSIILYSSVACLALVSLIVWAHACELLLLGAAAAIAFLIQALLKQLGRATRMSSQLTGAIALSSTSAGAYYLATGHFGRTAVLIWLANWLLAANQIHFVQLRIHSARALTLREKLGRGKAFLLHQAACLLLLIVIWRAGWIPALAVLAFAPILLRGLAWFGESPHALQVHRLGWKELIYAVVFGLFFIAGYY